ncbi:MAG: hypothetical protein LBL90_07055 [Prevotellaceae bacterium]|nr:hypothetical protein [Prevotellaceae bacterium]
MLFKESMDEPGYKNYIIFDADSEVKCKNTGSCKKRKTTIEEKGKELAVDFELFLFPNDEDDGDVELLWEKVINRNHSRVLIYFESFETCLKQHKDDNGSLIYKTPNQKNKIYTYISSQKISNKERTKLSAGGFIFEKSEYWDLDCEYLTTLKDFLRKILNEPVSA